MIEMSRASRAMRSRRGRANEEAVAEVSDGTRDHDRCDDSGGG